MVISVSLNRGGQGGGGGGGGDTRTLTDHRHIQTHMYFSMVDVCWIMDPKVHIWDNRISVEKKVIRPK